MLHFSHLFRNAFITALVIIIFAKTADSQVAVYAQASKGDSIDIAIKDLFKELGKAGFGQYNLFPPEAYKGSGIVLLETRKKGNNSIAIPVKLRGYGPEGIYIKGNEKSVILAGNSALALQEAVFIYLEQLGFRYLMPGSIWEEIPSLRTVYKSMDILTQPDFMHRNITNGHGYYNKNQIAEDFFSWSRANRLGGAFEIRVGHAYDEIMLRNVPVFKEHPEYFAQTVARGTLPENPKFNVANKELVQLVIRDAAKRLEESRTGGLNTMMVSMEPSDGPGFCTTPECKKIGGASEQVYFLSNAVLRELRKKNPDVWVGCLAYLDHMLPPSFNVEPNTFVMVTNAFNSSGLTTEQLLKKWKQKVSAVGIYDYISVYEWDNDLPGQVTAANAKENQKRVKKFYDAGARAYLAESTMGWVSRGPGQYILARILWDRNTNIETIRIDFFNKAFGNVAGLVRKLYDEWEEYPHRIAMENDLANWLSWVNEAYINASSEKIRKRIDQLKMYLHYLVLYRKVKMDPTEDNMQEMMKYAYRTFETPAFATLPTLVSLPNYSGFPKMGLYASPDQKYKKDDRPFSNAELQSVFQLDIRQVKRTAETTVFKKADGFVKLNEIASLKDLKFRPTGHAYWGATEFVIRITKKDTGSWFTIYSNLIKTSDLRPVEIAVYPYTKNSSGIGDTESLLRFTQTKGEAYEKYSLKSLLPGYYTLRVNDPMKMFMLKFSPAIDYSIVLNAREKLLTTTAGDINVFFMYVPKGVKNFRVSKTVIVKFETPSGRIIDYANNKDEVFDVEVKPGEEGIWTIFYQSGNLYIDGVPPYLGDIPSRMLVPSYLKNK
jgi:hypothetical protein